MNQPSPLLCSLSSEARPIPTGRSKWSFRGSIDAVLPLTSHPSPARQAAQRIDSRLCPTPGSTGWSLLRWSAATACPLAAKICRRHRRPSVGRIGRHAGSPPSSGSGGLQAAATAAVRAVMSPTTSPTAGQRPEPQRIASADGLPHLTQLAPALGKVTFRPGPPPACVAENADTADGRFAIWDGGMPQPTTGRRSGRTVKSASGPIAHTSVGVRADTAVSCLGSGFSQHRFASASPGEAEWSRDTSVDGDRLGSAPRTGLHVSPGG